MNYFEKYRDYSLISKIIAGALFLGSATSVLIMLANIIRYDFSFNFWTILYQSMPIMAGIIFFLNKHHDKIYRMGFAGAYVIVRLITLIRNIASGGNTSFIYILTSFLSLVFSVAFCLYYLGIIRAAGRKNYFIVMYALIGVSALFTIFNHPISSVSDFAMCSVLALYSYQETRASNPTVVYAGMVGTAYFVVYKVLSNLLSIISLIPKVNLYLPGFFSSMNIVFCLAMPLLVFDRIVPGEGLSFGFDFGALSGQAPAPQYAQPPMQQNGFAQPVQNQYQQPAAPAQNNFDPMTGQPLNPQPPVQQNNFDPMTGQPIQQQNRFDPMTGQPIDPNNGQQ